MTAEMSQWSLTQIKSTEGKRPYIRRSHASGSLVEDRPSPKGKWQLMGVRSCHGPAPFFVPPTQKDQRPAPDQTCATGKHSIDYVVTTPPASIRCLLRTQNNRLWSDRDRSSLCYVCQRRTR